MKKSVICTSEDVRGILAGRKTQFRIPCDISINGNQKIGHEYALGVHFPRSNLYGPCANFYGDHMPATQSLTERQLFYVGAAQQPFNVGDMIYVRETVGYGYYAAWDQKTFYKADYPDGTPDFVARWIPAASMPREEARLFLKITQIGIQRLQDISFEDCKKEGIWDDYKTYSEQYHENLQRMSYPKAFRGIWDEKWSKKNNGVCSWNNNPWVWVITFELAEKKEEREHG